MDTALTVLEPPGLPAKLVAPLKLAADFAQASKAPATQAAYGSDFRIFEAWGAQRAGFLRCRPPLRRSAASWPTRRPLGGEPARWGDV